MGGNMPSSDKVLASSVAKGATRELSNKGANIGNMSQGASTLPKDKGPTADPGKAVVTKRQNIDAPSSPGYHNVYVRRKVESEHNKVNSFQELKGNGKDKIKEQEAPLQDVQHDEVNKPQVASPVDKPVEVELVPVDKPVEVELISSEKTNVETVPEKINVETVPEKPNVETVPEKPNVETVPEKPNVETVPEKPNVETVPEKTELPAASAAGKQDDAEQLSIQYWNERFNRLQTYLENCDRSTQEGYLRKLRSLSAVGRSMHAIELEKRAIHLLVEEGKELQRMKALNVLGKVSPNASSKQMPLQRQLQK